jgi:hypothetical protein
LTWITCPVALLVMATSAPGTTASLGSVIVPTILPVATVVCAKSDGVRSSSNTPTAWEQNRTPVQFRERYCKRPHFRGERGTVFHRFSRFLHSYLKATHLLPNGSLAYYRSRMKAQSHSRPAADPPVVSSPRLRSQRTRMTGSLPQGWGFCYRL